MRRHLVHEGVDMNWEALFAMVDRNADELIKGQDAIEKQFGARSFKTLQVTKRNKKTFVVTAEMKDGTVQNIKVKY